MKTKKSIVSSIREQLTENKIEKIREIGIAISDKIEGGFLSKNQAQKLQKEIYANYNQGLMKFGKDDNDIRLNVFNYHTPIAEKKFNGVNLRITEGLIEEESNSNKRRKTYLLYADGVLIGKFYSINDIKIAVKFIEDRLIKNI